MSMLADFLAKSRAELKGTHADSDSGMMLPHQFLKNGADADNDHNSINPKHFMGNKESTPPDAVTGDDGMYSTDQSNPFMDAIRKSRQNGDRGPGVLKQFFDQLMSDPKPIKDQGGLSAPVATPSDISRGPDLPAPLNDGSPVPLPTPRPAAADYSMPTAIDPQSIEQLRQSLLTDAGQKDPSNPNGLAGRMASPNGPADMGQQQNQSMGIEDSIRGFDGGTKPPNPGFTEATAPTGDVSSALPDLSAMLASMI